MSNINHLASASIAISGTGLLAGVQSVTLNTTGNAVISMPILRGGLTVGSNVASSGSVILRRVSVMNPTGSLASANVSITTSNDGNVSNAVVASTVLSSLTGTATFQDLPISGGNAVVSGFTTPTLYVNINTASGNSNTAEIRVYGDTVQF
jgi:hypothetical protein